MLRLQQILDTLCPDKRAVITDTSRKSDPCVRNRIRNILFVLPLLAAAALAAAPASAQQPYDGLWQVTVVTKSGSCDASTSSTVTVSEGRISGGGPPSPAASAAGDLCESRSMVHMRTVNSVATPDRESGMAHQRAYRVAVDGKHPVNKSSRTAEHLRLFAAARICGRRVFLGRIDRLRVTRSPGRMPAWPADGPAAAPSRWMMVRSERIRCRATYRVSGHNMDMSADLRQRRLQVQSVRPMSSTRAARSPAPGARPAATSAAPCRAVAAAAISRWSPARPASMPASRCAPPATNSRSRCAPTASSAAPISRSRNSSEQHFDARLDRAIRIPPRLDHGPGRIRMRAHVGRRVEACSSPSSVFRAWPRFP